MLGLWTQSSPSTLPLGLHVCQLNVSVHGNTPLLNVTRSWCDGSNETVSADSRLVWPSAGKQVPDQRVLSRLWTTQVYMGIEYDVTSPRHTVTSESTPTHLTFEQSSTMLSSQQRLDVTEHFSLQVSGPELVMGWTSAAPALNLTATFWKLAPHDDATPRGSAPALAPSSSHLPALVTPSPSSPGGDPSGVGATRSVGGAPRGGLGTPWYDLALSDAWELVDRGLHDNVLALSLQGLANRQVARLYLSYPTDWAYGYTAHVRDWVASSRASKPTTLPSLSAALSALAKDVARGFVLWDPTGGAGARSSLLVAMTAAGIEDALVATPAQRDTLEALGLRLIPEGDFTTRFRNMSDAAVHQWQKERYWHRASKEQLLWLGGECGTQVRPGIADIGISRRLFFTDLSTRPLPPPIGTSEYDLADALIAEAAAHCLDADAPPLTVMGWHSYCKDFEHTFVTLTSRHGSRVHGLNTNPNLSFMSQLPLPEGYTFKNRPLSSAATPSAQSEAPLWLTHTAQSKAPLPRVAMAFVQTDGIGLGAWNKPSRGGLPYAWEVTLPDLEIQPSLLQMFYDEATANDTFVACLGGPGYMYPKAAATSGQLPRLLALAGASMTTLDLHAMIAFDASDAGTGSHTVTGDTTLSAEVVQAYATHLPEAKILLNGYGPSFTFAVTTRPTPEPANFSTISFDYYLDPERGVAAAAADLVSLAHLNPQAPYLLAVHVREYSSVGRVAQILAALPPGVFDLLPVHEWMHLANAHPTFRPRIR